MWEKVYDIQVPGDEDSYQVDYDKEKGKYRISIFKDNHFQDEIIFDKVDEENR